MKVLHLIVDYKSKFEVANFINSIDRSFTCNVKGNVDYSLVVLCNSGINDYIEFDSSKLCVKPKFIDTSDNIGYLPTVSRYLLRSGINVDDFDYIIFSNVDMLLDVSFFEELRSISDEADIIAPSIVTSEGVYQNPFMPSRPSKSSLQFLKFVLSYDLTFYLYSKISYFKSVFFKSKPSGNVKKMIYAPHGSMVILRSSYFENCDLEHGLFLYGEEIYIAESCYKNNKAVLYAPQLKVVHCEHRSTSLLSISKKRKLLLNALSNYMIQRTC